MEFRIEGQRHPIIVLSTGPRLCRITSRSYSLSRHRMTEDQKRAMREVLKFVSKAIRGRVPVHYSVSKTEILAQCSKEGLSSAKLATPSRSMFSIASASAASSVANLSSHTVEPPR